LLELSDPEDDRFRGGVMQGLEQLVRPFRDPGAIVNQRIIADNTAAPVTRARAEWGTAGGMPTATEVDTGVQPLQFKVEQCDAKYNETSRNTTKHRVENPDDSSQYVIVESISKITFQHTEQSKIVGAIRSETTTFTDIDPFAGTPFGDVQKQDDCKSEFNLKGT
jgi:hypothetical protein